MKSSKTVAIVGVGAVGQMLAYYLRSAGFEVLLYGRDGARALSQTVRVGGNEINLEIACQNREADIWFFSTKAFDLASAVLKWMPQIASDRPLVLLANGYIEPSLAGIRGRFPDAMLRKAVVSRGAKFDAEGQLVLSDRGEILWGVEGEPSLIEAEIMAALSESGFRWDAKTCEARKIKWYCNTVLNSLAGAYRLSRNADALLQRDFDPLCHEVYLLGLSFWPDWAGQEEFLKAKLKGLIAMTSENENSMAVDVRLGRKTESEFLSGYVMMVEKAQIRFPILHALHQRLLNR